MSDRLAGLVPRPQSARPFPGTLALTPNIQIRAAQTANPTSQAAAATVRRVLTSLPWPDGLAAQDSTGVTVSVRIASDLNPEAYHLTISEVGIEITAGGAAGAFYATQTIRQLLPDDAWRAAPALQATEASAPWHLPCAQIEDAPALPWRGGHLDVARHFIPKRELLALIDAFASVKLNRLHLHLTDDQGWRIESHRYPALHEIGSHRTESRLTLGSEDPVYDGTPHGGYYTLKDLAEISAYATQRMMTVVPEIDVPGHATALLAALPELAAGALPPGGYQVTPDWGIFSCLMTPLPAGIDFLRNVFGELLDAIPAKVVHIGGDECVMDSWRDDPAIDAYRRQRGLADAAALHAAFLRDVADLLADDFGARAVVWDEGFASTGGQAGMLRDDTIVMAWRGEGIARRAAEAGHEVIATPVLPTYFDYYQSDDDDEPMGIGGPVRAVDVAGFSPVPEGWPEAVRERLIGTQFQVWTEYIPSGRELEYALFPRACLLADVAWTGHAVADKPPKPGKGAGDGLPEALKTRLVAQLSRLDAAGLEYRPLAGPAPGQRGGTGARRHRRAVRVRSVMKHLDELAATAG